LAQIKFTLSLFTWRISLWLLVDCGFLFDESRLRLWLYEKRKKLEQ